MSTAILVFFGTLALVSLALAVWTHTEHFAKWDDARVEHNRSRSKLARIEGELCDMTLLVRSGTPADISRACKIHDRISYLLDTFYDEREH